MSQGTQSTDWIEEEQQKIERNGGNIGWNGKSLYEMVGENERLLEETGNYHGLDRLELKNENRAKYEQMYSQLKGGVVNARETSVDVSASPIVEQEGECCFVLYTPEGDAITHSTGILVHVHTASEAIKYMIKHDYEDNPGIEPGDIFCNNDAQIGNVHTSDVQTIIPIFWDGELVAWAAGITHVIESGAVSYGSMPYNAGKRYGDGFFISAEKVGREFELDPTWVTKAKHSVRTPDFWQLDEKTRLTGCLMIRDAVHDVIREEGIESFKQLSREVIEETRVGTTERVKKMLVPGTYREVGFAPHKAEQAEMTHPEDTTEHILHAPLETEVQEDGGMYLDLEGANRWAWHGFNGTPATMQGGLWVTLTETLIPGGKINDGAYYAMGFNFPAGTWVNPQNTEVGHSYAWLGPQPAWQGLWSQLNHGYVARGFVEEACAGSASTGNILQGGGMNQYDQSAAITNFEIACQGFGAYYTMDGKDYSGTFWNPEGDMGDAEIWEMTEPLLYLGRHVKPNLGGPGRHRGGSGLESLRMVHSSKRWYLSNLSTGGGIMFSESGVFGGYPAATAYSLESHDTDLEERFENEDSVPNEDLDPESGEFEEQVSGETTRTDRALVPDREFDDYELYLNVTKGGPGYGDPLERKPERVKEDIEEGFLLPRYAESVYGVVVTEEETEQGTEYSIDHEETERLRDEMRAKRGEKAVKFEEWENQERERIMENDAIDVVKKTYKSSFEMSDAFEEKFRTNWDLPESWDIEMSEESEKELRQRLQTPSKPIWDQEEITMYDMGDE